MDPDAAREGDLPPAASTIPDRLYGLIGEILVFTAQVDSAWAGEVKPGSGKQITQGEVPR